MSDQLGVSDLFDPSTAALAGFSDVVSNLESLQTGMVHTLPPLSSEVAFPPEVLEKARKLHYILSRNT